jgi:hypothetical protein
MAQDYFIDPELIDSNLLSNLDFHSEGWDKFRERYPYPYSKPILAPEKQIYFEYKNKDRDDSFKIHLMCKPNYRVAVLDRILRNIDKFDSFKFKIITNNSAEEFPFSTGFDLRVLNGKNPEEHRTIYTGIEYRYDGKMYKTELIYSPCFVFYLDMKFFRETLDALIRLFPDDKTSELVWKNYYPRFNFCMNNMIYVATTGADDKFKQYTCTNKDKIIECTSNKKNFYTLPIEYLEIQEKCEKIVDQAECTNINEYSKKVSDSILCEWNGHKCTKNLSLLPQFLLQGKMNILGYEDNEDEDEIYEVIPPSIKRNVYDIYGQSQLYDTKLSNLKKI